MARAAREAWGNPSSVHAVGRRARAIVEDAREAVARLARADARDVVLTAGVRRRTTSRCAARSRASPASS